MQYNLNVSRIHGPEGAYSVYLKGNKFYARTGDNYPVHKNRKTESINSMRYQLRHIKDDAVSHAWVEKKRLA